jgi:hypothetical protein
MRVLSALLVLLLALLPGARPALAGPDSQYSKLDLDNGCCWDPQSEQEAEESLGNCGWCDGIAGYPVRFCEGDLRQSVLYGEVDAESAEFHSFGQFNYINPTIEWRVEGGRPYAAIQRRFIENSDPKTGEVTEAVRGQVLVVSTVAEPGGLSCPVAYVDARANSDANELARQAADTVARSFRCGVDEAQFVGKRGPLAGDPY